MSRGAGRSRRSRPSIRSCLGWARRSTSWHRWTTTTQPSRGRCSTTSSALLFEDDPASQVDPGNAISFHSAGGERAEVELAAARILELLRPGGGAGVEPGDVAVVFRDPARYSSLLEQVFGAYGIPYSIDRRLPFGHTGLGRGLLAMIRSATPAGTADDLLAYLRTPGLLKVPGLADRLEADVRKEGAHRAEQARALWERDHWPLEELDRLARARDTAAFVTELEARLVRLFAAPYERSAAVLSGPELDEARALREAQKALGELRAVLGRQRADAGRVLRVLEQLEVNVGERPQPDRVQVATPEAIRARRFEVVFACGLQEGEFPRGASPEPFLSDEDRRAIATRERPRAAGARGPARPRALPLLRLRLARRAAADRSAPARATRRATRRRSRTSSRTCASCSWHGADERTRSLSDVTWSADEAPTAAELDRAHAFAGPRRPEPAAGRAQRRAAAGAPGRAGGRVRRRARALRRLPGEVARRGPAEARRARTRPRGDGARLVRARGAAAHLPPAPRGDRRAARDARQPRGGGAHPARRAARAPLGIPAVPEADACARGRPPPRVRPSALPALGGRLGHRLRTRGAGARVRVRRWRRAGGDRGRAAAARAHRPRGREGRHGPRDRLQDAAAASTATRWRAGSPRTASRRRSTCWWWSGCSACAPSGGVYVALGERRPAPARDGRRRGGGARQRLLRQRPPERRGVPRQARLGARSASARRMPGCAAARSARVRTAATGTAAASTPRSAGATGDGG